MWDQHPMMKDWECMTDILLEAPDQEEDRKDFFCKEDSKERMGMFSIG